MPAPLILAAAAFLGGLVRGFSGFGTAMVFLPIAGQFLSPVAAIIALIVMDVFGPLPLLPRAARDGHPPDVARLLIGSLIVLPFGLLLLSMMEPAVFRSTVAVVSLILLAILISGFRYRGTLKTPMIYGIGGTAGFLGGIAGVAGPPVILFYMASPLPAAAIRANTMMFLFGFDFLMLGMFAYRDDLTWATLITGVALAAPNVLGNLAGAAIFRPEKEKLYRVAAYLIITASALSALIL
ncbi:sulfite exporter TauE/SafE family protein [Thalassococcus lentus]|uniref:Probable membrane transporter protein n=1 Tax=Thalassococcus lentus TaxID=1210524 RepID=A0ABT4XX69_9RHOB|nr:sulfite exporter TauE/SafE family protein [Thalassococcus lentus]MDA7426565.1 sulfite exporter TauE/SafE family protein [Thalassococcus lentus]